MASDDLYAASNPSPAPDAGSAGVFSDSNAIWDAIRARIERGDAWAAVSLLTEMAPPGTPPLPVDDPIVVGISDWFWDAHDRYLQGPLRPVGEMMLRLCPAKLKPMCNTAKRVLSPPGNQTVLPDMAARAAYVLIRGLESLHPQSLPSEEVAKQLDRARGILEGIGGPTGTRGVALLFNDLLEATHGAGGSGRIANLLEVLHTLWRELPKGTRLWAEIAGHLVRHRYRAAVEKVSTVMAALSRRVTAAEAWRLEPLWPVLLERELTERLDAPTLRRLRPLTHRWWYRLVIDLELADHHGDQIAHGALEGFLRLGPDVKTDTCGIWPYQLVADYFLGRGRLDAMLPILERIRDGAPGTWDGPGFTRWFRHWFPDSPPVEPTLAALDQWIIWLNDHTKTLQFNDRSVVYRLASAP